MIINNNYLDVSLELSVGGVVLEHVDHVVQGDEGVVDGNDLSALGDGGPEDQATDAAESVDSDLSGREVMLKRTLRNVLLYEEICRRFAG